MGEGGESLGRARRVNGSAARCRAAVLLAVIAGAVPAHAQYPAKAVRLIVPVLPGGGSDTTSRILAPRLSEALGQQVVVENRPGSGTNIGAEIVAKSPPDGYTLLMAGSSLAVNVTLYSRLNYSFVRDLAPVSLLVSTPHFVAVHPSVPARSVKELIALARVRPGQLTFSSSGNGSPAHLGGELFNSMAGTRMNHVPYKGGGPAVVALVSGEAAVSFATMPSVLQFVRAGRLRGLATTSAQRTPSAPEFQTVDEAGLKGFELSTWFGLMAPAGTPREIVSRLHAESVRILKARDARERLEAAGLDVIGTTPDEFAAYIRTEIEKWGKAVKLTGARAD
jgi:tripartite-type tricarboxylate transporter receptor subunit TctC